MNIFLIIIFVSALLAFAGYIWLVVTGFRKNIFWGILVLLFSPLTAVIFAALNWFDAKKAFIAYILPTLIMFGTYGYMFSKIGPENLAEINKRMQSGELRLKETMRVIDKAMNLQGSQKLFEETPALASVATNEAQAAAVTDAGVEVAKDKKLDLTDAAKVASEKSGNKAVPEQQSKSEKVLLVEEEDDKKPSSGYPKLSQVKPDPLAIQKKAEDPDFVTVKFENARNYKDRYFVIYTNKETFLRGLLVKADKDALYLNRKLFGGSFEYRVSKKKISKIYMLKKEFVMERDRNRLPKQ